MHNFPFFSITIPTYKDVYLRECLDSILEQTYDNFEIIIVNDASPFDIDSIINEYNDHRIRYFKNEKNFGALNVVHNWNKCLEYSNGDYIICMGDDDKLLPNLLKDYVDLINKYPGLGVYHSWSEVIDENSTFVEITASRCEYESAYSLLWHRWNCRRRQFIGDFLFDTSLLKNNGGFFFLPLAWGSDEVSSVIAAIPYGIANTQTIGFCYRVNTLTISKTGDAENKLKALSEYEKWCIHFLEKAPKNELDKKFWMCLNNQREKYFEREKALEIAGDLHRNSLFSIIRWYHKRNALGLNKRIFLFSLYEAIKRCLKS